MGFAETINQLSNKDLANWEERIKVLLERSKFEDIPANWLDVMVLLQIVHRLRVSDSDRDPYP